MAKKTKANLCTTVIHNTAQNSDNLPSYPLDNHHCSDVTYWRGEGIQIMEDKREELFCAVLCMTLICTYSFYS